MTVMDVPLYYIVYNRNTHSQIVLHRTTDPIAFLRVPVSENTSGRVYDDLVRLDMILAKTSGMILSYLYLFFETLLQHLLFLIHLWSYFQNNLLL